MMTNLSLYKPVKREKQRMKINLKDESNLVSVSISPHLTNDTLFIKEDFFPKKFNDFFYKGNNKISLIFLARITPSFASGAKIKRIVLQTTMKKKRKQNKIKAPFNKMYARPGIV